MIFYIKNWLWKYDFGTFVCFISRHFCRRSYENQLSFSGKGSIVDFFVFHYYDQNTKNKKWNEPDIYVKLSFMDISLKKFHFEYVESWPKMLLFRTHHLWNSTTELILNYTTDSWHKLLVEVPATIWQVFWFFYFTIS